MVEATRTMTLSEFDALPDDGNRYELIDGVLYVAAAPQLRHNLTVLAVRDVIHAWIRPRRLGTVTVAPFDVALDRSLTSTVVQPDVVYIRQELLPLAVSGRLEATPDLVVEVLSPTTANVDRFVKLNRFAQAGIPEYWILDPAERSFAVLALDENQFRLQSPDDSGRFVSTVIEGLVVDPQSIWADVDDQMPPAP